MNCVFRTSPDPADIEAVRLLAARTGFFRPDEIDVAAELVEERLAKGAASGYYFYFAETDAVLAGYVCYGPTPCTIGSFDLYWIVVDKDFQGQGLGLSLAAMAEESARSMGGRRMYVDTSGRELYRPTQRFYVKAGYVEAARLSDFYDIGDDKIIFQKQIDHCREFRE